MWKGTSRVFEPVLDGSEGMYGSIEMIADTARESVDDERVNQVSDAISCPLSPPPIL